MKFALRIGILASAFCVLAALVWQGLSAHGAPDPTRPNTSATVALLDIGVLVFREGLECILVLAAITASVMLSNRVRPAMNLEPSSDTESTLEMLVTLRLRSTLPEATS